MGGWLPVALVTRLDPPVPGRDGVCEECRGHADAVSPKGGGWEDLLVCPSEQGFTHARLSKPSSCTDLFALQN